MLPVAVARSSSDDNAIHYIISSFVDDVMFSHNIANRDKVTGELFTVTHQVALGEVCTRRLPCSGTVANSSQCVNRHSFDLKVVRYYPTIR